MYILFFVWTAVAQASANAGDRSMRSRVQCWLQTKIPTVNADYKNLQAIHNRVVRSRCKLCMQVRESRSADAQIKMIAPRRRTLAKRSLHHAEQQIGLHTSQGARRNAGKIKIEQWKPFRPSNSFLPAADLAQKKLFARLSGPQAGVHCLG